MITTRIYKQEDYDTISGWWADQSCYVPDHTQLDTLGVIASDDGTDVCYMCAYCVSGVAIAFLDHLVTNPGYKRAVGKLKAVDAMMSEILQTLRARGYQLIKAVTWSDTLSKICQKRYGFKPLGGELKGLTMIL